MENSEGHVKSCDVIIFTTTLSNSVKVTQIVNRNAILLTQFALVYLLTNFLRWYYEQLELSLLILVCIHKSFIVYFEISVVLTGHGFSFFGHGKVVEKSWKINVGKEGAPCWKAAVVKHTRLLTTVTHKASQTRAMKRGLETCQRTRQTCMKPNRKIVQSEPIRASKFRKIQKPFANFWDNTLLPDLVIFCDSSFARCMPLKRSPSFLCCTGYIFVALASGCLTTLSWAGHCAPLVTGRQAVASHVRVGKFTAKAGSKVA